MVGIRVGISITGGRGSKPIRTSAEIAAHIKILPVHQPYLYQKLAHRATQLRLLGMTYEQIAKSLKINRKTAKKACGYEGEVISCYGRLVYTDQDSHGSSVP